jgi:hypothetical protein
MNVNTTAPQSVARSVRYVIADGNASETADTFAELLGIARGWYDYMDYIPRFPQNVNPENIDELQDAINDWQDKIANANGHKDFHGLGNYSVSAADRMGLNLTVKTEDVPGQYAFATDGESGTIEAADFSDAKRQLDEMFSEDTIADGAWGWVQDVDGYRYTIGQ